MRRYMKLICLILSHVEKATEPGNIPIPEFQDYRPCQVAYHVQLCEEAGYLDVRMNATTKEPVSIIRMTWAGHEALERLRDGG